MRVEYWTFTTRSHSPGWDLTVEEEGRSALVRVSTVAGVLPLVTRAGKEERRRGESFMLSVSRQQCGRYHLILAQTVQSVSSVC